MISSCYVGSLFRPRNLFVVPSSCMRKDHVQELIFSKEAVPLPLDYDDIMDVMEWWGRSVSGTWQQSAMKLLFDSITTNHSMSWKDAIYESLVLLLEEKPRHHGAGYAATVLFLQEFQAGYSMPVTPASSWVTFGSNPRILLPLPLHLLIEIYPHRFLNLRH